MLACLPGPGDLSLPLHPHLQMNTGLQKWDTTQRMRSAQYPTPAELDAYAKKVANNPLTIKIFPNSVKVPQRNHIRRTVNGLDTAGPRYSPYPSSQATAKTGLLAIVKVPMVKGIIKDFDGTRARLHPEVIMNATGAPYAATSASTLNLHHPSQGPPRASQNSQGLPPHPQNFQTLQQQQQQSGHLHQGLRHPPAPSMLQQPQGLPRPQTLSHAASLGHSGPHPPSAILLPQQHLQNPPPSLQVAARKLPAADAPPNVTVSTSTIPLSMAGGVHQGRQADLNSIVHQISQFCQARAQGPGATSMCEGQIANPSPISRNLLINASTRVSVHPSAPHTGLMHPSCALGPPDKATASAPVSAMPPHNMAPINRMYHGEMKQHHQQHLQHQQHQPQRNPQMRWNQHPLAHLQHIPDGGGHPCKPHTHDTGLPCKGINYPPEMSMGQPYAMKPSTPSPSLANHNSSNAMPPGAVTHYTNGQYYHQPPMWGSILPTPNSDSSNSQDLTVPFHGPAGTGNTNPAPGMDCAPTGGAAHYRLVGGALIGQTNLMQTVDCMGGDFQTPCFRDQNLILMEKMHRPPPMGRVVVPPSDSQGQHPGYR